MLANFGALSTFRGRRRRNGTELRGNVGEVLLDRCIEHSSQDHAIGYPCLEAMQKAAKDLDFLEAARLRDELFALEKQLNK